MALDSDQRLETAMGRMLQMGVTVSALVVLAGGILYLVRAGGAKPDYAHFRGVPRGLNSVGGIMNGLVHWNAASLIAFGILLLIATPICRVIFGVVGFALLGDRFFGGVSLVVLAILLTSFLFSR
jgi:uncharacterized membrane protein